MTTYNIVSNPSKSLKALLLIYSLFLLSYSIFFSEPSMVGDGEEYLGMTISFFNHLSPDLRDDDIKLNEDILRKNCIPDDRRVPYYGYFESLDNKYYSYHFWAYSLLNLPIFYILNYLDLNEMRSFQISNSILLVICLGSLIYFKNLSPQQRLWLFLLSSLNPILLYVKWPHPEVFCYAFLTLAIFSALDKNYRIAVLASSIASLQSTPVMFFTFILILFGWNDRARRSNELIWLTSISIVSIIPYIFYYAHYNTLNLIVHLGWADVSYISLDKVLSLFFDFNFGLFSYVPLLLLVSILLLMSGIANRDFHTTSLWVTLFLMAVLFSTQYLWNCGMMYIHRYAILMCPIMIMIVIYNMPRHPRMTSKLLLLLSIFSTMAIVTPLLYEYDLDNHHKFNDLSTAVLIYAPSLYAPLPEVFGMRATGEDQYLKYIPIIYRYDGRTRKILADNKSLDYIKNLEALSDALPLSDDAILYELGYINYDIIAPRTIDKSKIKIYTIKSPLQNSELYPLTIKTIRDPSINRIQSHIESWDGFHTVWISNEAYIDFFSEEDGIAELNFNVVSFRRPRNLEIYDSKDRLVKNVTVPTSFKDMRISIPFENGFNSIRFFVPDGCESPCDILELDACDSRCLSVAFQNIPDPAGISPNVVLFASWAEQLNYFTFFFFNYNFPPGIIFNFELL